MSQNFIVQAFQQWFHSNPDESEKDRERLFSLASPGFLRRDAACNVAAIAESLIKPTAKLNRPYVRTVATLIRRVRY